MKSYTITVNGVAYEVTVEETTGGAAPAAAMPAMPKAPAQTAPMPAAPAPKAASAGAGANKIEVKTGQAVKKGDTVIILEAMKMEIPMVSPVDGTIASIDCAVGDAVEAGALLATVD